MVLEAFDAALPSHPRPARKLLRICRGRPWVSPLERLARLPQEGGMEARDGQAPEESLGKDAGHLAYGSKVCLKTIFWVRAQTARLRDALYTAKTMVGVPLVRSDDVKVRIAVNIGHGLDLCMLGLSIVLAKPGEDTALICTLIGQLIKFGWLESVFEVRLGCVVVLSAKQFSGRLHEPAEPCATSLVS
ncbi:uncharacterized protein PG986_003570 [Apiospora aurea]|uniref:Uncharacterized protein n=1 Tax=Apiospora aurea TaxID=335848 RepID=A0ABR1QS15_9PEZI